MGLSERERQPLRARFAGKPGHKARFKAAGIPWKGFHPGRRGLGTTLRVLTGNSNTGRDMLGRSDDAVTKAHYEAAMPEEVLKAMKLLESTVALESQTTRCNERHSTSFCPCKLKNDPNPIRRKA